MALLSGAAILFAKLGAIAGIWQIITSVIVRIVSYVFKRKLMLSIIVITMLKTFYDWITEFINSLVSRVEAIRSATEYVYTDGLFDTVIDIMEKANYVFPIDVIFSLMSGILVLWLASLTYRYIKSWLPTIN